MDPKDLQGIDPNSIPILGGKRFKCAKGHVQMATHPFALGLSPQIRTGPICPICVMDFLTETFPVKEEIDVGFQINDEKE